jgi:hypothetical protein
MGAADSITLTESSSRLPERSPQSRNNMQFNLIHGATAPVE